MIMTYTYVIDFSADPESGKTMITQIEEFLPRLTKLHPALRGIKLAHQGQELTVAFRVAGLTRWHIERSAKTLISVLVRKFKISANLVTFASMLSEHGRSYLLRDQGRTEMTRRPRSQRMADGRPWDHIAWEGEVSPPGS